MPELDRKEQPEYRQGEIPKFSGYRVYSMGNLLRSHFTRYVHEVTLDSYANLEEAEAWLREAEFITSLAISAISMSRSENAAYGELAAQGYHHVGDLVGSFARALPMQEIIGTNNDFLLPSVVYRRDIGGDALHGHPVDIGSLYGPVVNGPFDVGIRVDLTQNEQEHVLHNIFGLLQQMFQGESVCEETLPDGTTQYRFQTQIESPYVEESEKVRFARLRIRGRRYSYGKFALEVEFEDTSNRFPTFTLHVSNLDAELPGNMRIGSQFSDRQNFRVPLFVNTNEWDFTPAQDLIILSNQAYENMKAIWTKPDHIENPHYVSYGQGIYAGLRLIWHVLYTRKGNLDDIFTLITRETIDAYRLELLRLRQEPHEKIPWQIQRQIIQLAIVSADVDPILFLRLITVLGIRDVFDNTSHTLRPEFNYVAHDRNMQDKHLDDLRRYSYEHNLSIYQQKHKRSSEKVYPNWEVFNTVGSTVVARMLQHKPWGTPIYPREVIQAFMVR